MRIWRLSRSSVGAFSSDSVRRKLKVSNRQLLDKPPLYARRFVYAPSYALPPGMYFMGAKVLLWYGHGPCLCMASMCALTPYPLCASKPYSGCFSAI